MFNLILYLNLNLKLTELTLNQDFKETMNHSVHEDVDVDEEVDMDADEEVDMEVDVENDLSHIHAVVVVDLEDFHLNNGHVVNAGNVPALVEIIEFSLDINQ